MEKDAKMNVTAKVTLKKFSADKDIAVDSPDEVIEFAEKEIPISAVFDHMSQMAESLDVTVSCPQNTQNIQKSNEAFEVHLNKNEQEE